MNAGGGYDGFDGSAESSDDPEAEASSSTRARPESVEEALESFRLRWQSELRVSRKSSEATKRDVSEDQKNRDKEEAEAEDVMARAKALFLNGVELERAGKLFEATQSYRKAVQLVPDVEFRLEEARRKPREVNSDAGDLIVPETHEEEDELEEDTDEEDDSWNTNPKVNLLSRIQGKMIKAGCLCVPKISSKEMHISALPTEIILYILRWVVSSDLDVRSLEMFSQVCRGFYVCARDPEIWRSACERTWGLNCGNLSNNYSSWREMFLERAKLHFNGCYISRTTYIRHGESSFQDQFYRPWHVVAYYRYLRFFPEGIVLMLTTPDEPSQCVGLLKNRYPKGASILSGHYRLKDDSVTIYFHRQESKPQQQPLSGKRSRRKEPGTGANYDSPEQTFHLELKILGQNRRRHVQLAWTRYSVFTRASAAGGARAGAESHCSFDLVGSRFPPLWFSRVKSYALEAESPLV